MSHVEFGTHDETTNEPVCRCWRNCDSFLEPCSAVVEKQAQPPNYPYDTKDHGIDDTNDQSFIFRHCSQDHPSATTTIQWYQQQQQQRRRLHDAVVPVCAPILVQTSRIPHRDGLASSARILDRLTASSQYSTTTIAARRIHDAHLESPGGRTRIL